jgi:SIR2-like protein
VDYDEIRIQVKRGSQPSELDVYVFGAGASRVHGAPLTDTILPYAFGHVRSEDRANFDLIARFLADVFGFAVKRFDPKSRDPARNAYPGLVDILSTVDLALDRKENLARGYDLTRLRQVRDALNYAIFVAIERSLQGPPNPVTSKLLANIDSSKAVFISLNYDVIADIAIADAVHSGWIDSRPEDYPAALNYGVRFANVERPESKEGVPLLKLHGSFNWLWSRMTGEVYYGGLRKAIGDIYRARPDNRPSQYPEPMQDLEPILITPTHLKDLRNVHLASIWRAAEGYVRQAKQVTFIGYSLPGDDLHIKYLFKRGLTGRSSPTPPRITVVDFSEDRGVTSVQKNYQCFFGGNVHYYRHGFERYVREEVSNKPKQSRRARGASIGQRKQ